MKKLNFFILLVVIMHNIYAMDKEQKSDELAIRLVDDRSCRESREGYAEGGSWNGWLTVNVTRENSHHRLLWQRLHDGAYYIKRRRWHYEPFDHKWTIKKDDIPVILNIYNNI